MDDTPTDPVDGARRLRDLLVGAARDLTVEHGWARVRMVDVARAAGVSRQTVYNQFGGRTGLAQALAVAEIRRFTDAVRDELSAHGADVRAAGRAAILRVLTEAAGNPIVRGVVAGPAGGDDELLPFLTTRSDLALAAAGAVVTEWAGTHLPGVPEPVAAAAAESLIRLTISHVVLPSAPPQVTADVLADVLVRLLR